MKRKIPAQGSHGFSLIELMIVLGIFGVVSAAGYTIYRVQQRSYIMQEQLVEMQQNARAFLFFIEKDLRMAGYDVTKTSTAGFETAQPFEVVFSADIGRPRSDPSCKGIGCDTMPDGQIIAEDSSSTDDVKETIRYSLSGMAGAPVPDSYGRVSPGKTTSVTKTFNGKTKENEQEVIQGVEALEFLYNLSDGTAVTSVVGTDLENIRSVTVSLLMRTRNSLAGTKDTKQYYSASGRDWGKRNDSYRRNLIITNIWCRNMSLQNQN